MSLKSFMLSILILIFFVFLSPAKSQAQLQVNKDSEGKEFLRSLESVRDIDYQTWQLVLYPNLGMENKFILRVVGYPGDLRLDHPTSIKVHSGIKDWSLLDITLNNEKLVNDGREAAAEFDISTLILELKNDRPLRLCLEGVFSDLPIPPYLVGEWRSLINSRKV